MSYRLAILLGGCLAAGCSAVVSSAPENGGTVPAHLAGADEDDEFTGVLTEPALPLPAVEKVRRFGIRAGLFLPVAADEGAWGPSFSAGFYYRKVKETTRRQALELGFDYAQASRDDGSVDSKLLSFRGEMLFGNWEKGKGGAGVYFVGGADVVTELAEISSSGQSDTAFGFGLNLGVGLGPSTGAWDLRAVYTLYPGSGNVGGNVTVAAGYSF